MNAKPTRKRKRSAANYVAWKFGGISTKLEWPKRVTPADCAADKQYQEDLIAATRRYLEATAPKKERV